MREAIREHTARRGLLWASFLAVHAWNALVGIAMLARAFGDLELYRYWMWLGVDHGWWPVLDTTSVYPAGAVLPQLVAAVGGLQSGVGYAVAWCLMVTALDAAALLVLLRRPHGMAGAWWWTAFLLLLGPVGMGRLDAVVVPIMLAALLWALDRPAVAAVLLTAGAWIKVAPGALLWPLFAVARRPWREVLAPAVGLSALVVGTVMVVGDGRHILSFLTDQGGRGMQLEAVGATPWLLASVATPAITRVDNRALNDWELHGWGTQAATVALGGLFAVGMVLVAGLVWWRRERRGDCWSSDRAGAAELVVRGALLVTVAMIVLDKVGSPQYMTWLAPPVVAALGLGLPGWRRTARWVLVVAGVTQAVFPWLYPGITAGLGIPATVLAARNVILVVLLAWTARAIVTGAAVADHVHRRTDPSSSGTDGHGAPVRAPLTKRA
ncbi:hypothetical protein Q6348_04135 [Isoptericola sp. b441]|uniref:DUF2029 domain-containing protein n=1 Tax=Actinotalea lenta TaxID=3064654 RepID=A0ABT9D6C9_9CELL|nr:hypothetical protein [Isoptericola sp. b441]MDO8106383.1 hypothetical protein [Isoptericola sp. b441]